MLSEWQIGIGVNMNLLRLDAMDDINALARLLAVEVLLAEPELLGNDALEADLYILRDKLRKAAGTILSS